MLKVYICDCNFLFNQITISFTFIGDLNFHFYIRLNHTVEIQRNLKCRYISAAVPEAAANN